MLQLILGRDWTANRDEILRRIGQDVRQQKSGRILMVPELISHDTERRLCAAAGDTASRFAEVLSFTRLERRVAESVGAAAQQCLDNGGRVAAMASACRQLHSRLKAYASVETKPEFLTELVDAVDEFKRCCITSADLKQASEQTEGSLAQKLEELSLILEAYDSLCSRGKRDPRDQMNWLLEEMEEGDFAQTHVFYIDGFPDFTRQHFAILEHLIRNSPLVTIALTCDQPNTQELAFEKAAATARDLLQCARKFGIDVQIDRIAPKASILEPVRRGLFQGSLKPVEQLRETLLLRRAETLFQECQGAADRIAELVRRGCRYREIGVVCADMGAYADVLRLVFRRCNIPLYQSGTEDILSKSAISTVLSALDAALDGFEQKDVLRYLKSILSPVEEKSCDLLENYVILWGISGSQWHRPFENHPDGLGEVWDEAAYQRLSCLNDTRQLAVEPLLRLSRDIRDGRVLKDYVLALVRFLEDISFPERLQKMAGELDALGDNRQAQILNQLWEILLSALEQLHDILGDTAWDADTFPRLLKLVLSQYDVGTIPPVLDAVSAGPVSAMRCTQVRHLLVLGALEGAMPGYGGSKGVLTDQERVALRQMGVPLTGGSMEGLQAEFSEIYGVFCGAEESIQVSCPAGQPSYIYKRLSMLAGMDSSFPQTAGPAAFSAAQAGGYLAAWGAQDQARALGVLDSYQKIRQRSAYQLGKISRETVPKLYGKCLRLSASQVDKHAQCRLAYFLKYGLRASERKEATVDPAEFGTYVHAVLEHTGRTVMEKGGFHQVTMEQTLDIALEYSDSYAREKFSGLQSKRLAYLFQRNVSELKMVVRELWNELHHARFVPFDFELAFGEGGKMDAIRIPSDALPAQLRGFVDRVDTWKDQGRNYFRVVDYKTGKKDFDYCDVFNGIGLQMFLYLFALEQEGEALLGANPIPAGVQYFPARCPHIRSDGRLSPEEADAERGKSLKRRGLLLADGDVLEAMEPEGAPPRLNCARKKDGSYTGDVADRDQLKLLRQYVFKLLRDMVEEIASGRVDPNPYTRGSVQNACTYCPYQPVCDHTNVPDRRNYKAMTAERFWQEVDREVSSHG